jgi:hypothetical protein
MPGTDELQPTDGVEPFVETVDASTPMIRDHTPEEESARVHTDTEQETVQGSALLRIKLNIGRKKRLNQLWAGSV